MATTTESPQYSSVMDLVNNIAYQKYGPQFAEIEKQIAAMGTDNVNINDKINAELPAYIQARREEVIQSLMAPTLKRAQQLREEAARTREAKLGDSIRWGLINLVLADEDSVKTIPQQAAEAAERKADLIEKDARSQAEARYNRRPEYRGLEEQFQQDYMNSVIVPLESQYEKQGQALAKQKDELRAKLVDEKEVLFNTLNDYYEKEIASPEYLLQPIQAQLDRAGADFDEKSARNPANYEQYKAEYQQVKDTLLQDANMVRAAFDAKQKAFFNPNFLGRPEDFNNLNSVYEDALSRQIEELRKAGTSASPSLPGAQTNTSTQQTNPFAPTGTTSQTPTSQTPATGPVLGGQQPATASPSTPADSSAFTPPPNFSTPSAPKVVRAPQRSSSDLVGRASVVDAPQQQPGLINNAGLLNYTPTINAPAGTPGLLTNQNPMLYIYGAPGARLPGQMQTGG